MGICVSCRRRERKAPEKRWVPGAGGPAKGAAAELLPRRVHLPAMANSISNIKMTNPIKGIVSKRRKRYVKDGFNLDLAYITDRLIAMGFPAEKLEGVYRNHIDEVYRFLEQMHKDHYKIYNLCAERSYDSNKFHKRVERFAFEDHAPPKIEQIRPFCENVHEWLNKDSRNVAAVHCKAGKGRTGTMVCCYLLYSGQKATADEALKFYGIKRAHDEKGVTIPSQRRYVEYFAALVRGGLSYRATRVHVRELLMSPPPALTGLQATLELSVSQLEPQFKAPLGAHELRRHDSAARVSLAACTPLQGDVRVDVYYKPKMMMRKERLFHFWFNTFFVTACVGATPVPAPHDSPNLETFKLTLDKWQLDDAHKDKQHKLYSPDFKVELIIQKQPESSTFSTQSIRAPSTPSTASSCSDADEHWDSGEPPHTREPPAHTPPPYCDDRTRNPPAHTPPTPNVPPPYCDHRTLCMDTSFELKSFPDEPVVSDTHKSNDVPSGDLLCEESLCTNINYPLSMDRRGPVVMCDGNDRDRDQRFDDNDGMYDNVRCPVNKELYPKNINTSNDSQLPIYNSLYLENSDRTKYDVSQAPKSEYSVNRNQNPSHRCKDTVNNGNKHIDDSPYTHRSYPIKTERYTVNPEYTIESDIYVNKRSYPVNTVFTNKMEYSLNTNIYLEKQSLNAVYPTKSEYPINKNLYTDDSEYSASKEKLSEYRVDTGSSKNDLDRKDRKFKDALCKPRLSLGDMRASWREFSGKFAENRKKKHRDDCQ